MSKRHEEINFELAAWIARQHIFFVATAPLTPNGHINTSPKGGDSFRILGPLSVAYQDYTGSGAETAAHLQENGRIVVMFCAFEGPPKIVRLHGRGEVIPAEHPRYAEMAALFPPHAGTRCFISISVERVSDSCGYAVPHYDYCGPRDMLDKWTNSKSAEELRAYRHKHGQQSLDGLPAFKRNA